MRPKRPRLLITVAAFAALAGCDRREAPSPAPTPVETASPDAEKVSIIREDVGIEREAPAPMAPLRLRIGFDDGGANLSEAAIAALSGALASDQMKGGGAITLGGHTDSAGLDSANLRASQKRADAVAEWLVDNGVGEDRITTIAFGEQNPAAPNARPDGSPDEAGRARNRRVEMTIAVPPGAPAAAPTTEGTLVEELTEPK